MKNYHLWRDGVYRDRPQPTIRAEGLRVTRLDADGRPVPNSTVTMTGEVVVEICTEGNVR